MRHSFKYFLIGLGVFSSIAAANAATVVIEGFENNADPGDWRATSPAPQSNNHTNPGNAAVPNFLAANVTEGSLAGEFTTTWVVPGIDAGSNPHIAGGPLRFWAIRYNANSPTALNGNAISTSNGVLVADLYNNNPYPVSFAIVCDTALSTQLERGPYLQVAANSSATYTWDMAATAPVGWVSGNSSFDGAPNARVKTLLLYTETEPTATASSFFVDNIRNTNAQTDATAPGAPVPYSAKQGAAPGQLTVTWAANVESDLNGYNIFLATDDNFSSPTTNRLTFSAATSATVAAGVNTVTLNGVPTDKNVYVQVRAFDNATPLKNESEGGTILGARLSPTGAAVQDHVVLDYDRELPGTSNFSISGYLHGVVYNGRALHAMGRYYDTVSAKAIDAGAQTLSASPLGMTIWSNLLDGSGATSIALSDLSVASLTTFLNANGNLMISGAGLVEDLSTRGSAQQTFLADKLLASLGNANIAQAGITGTAPLASMGSTVITNASNFENMSALSTNSNDSLVPLGTATATGQYTGSGSPDAGVVHDNQVVTLGYAFESAAGATIAESETVRLALMQDILNYLVSPADVTDWTLY